MQNITTLFCGLGLLLAGWLLFEVVAPASANQNADKAAAKPVTDMHHFMEYVFEPNYKSLKSVLASEPADKAAWSKVKAGSLTLAEGGNLLLLRVPEKDAEDWIGWSVAVREEGGKLYEAARKSDYETSKQQYLSMLKNCNACHKKFAKGKYQLSP